MNVIRVLRNDEKFKSNVKFASLVTAGVIAYGSWYCLNHRVSTLETRLNGKVEAYLEPAPIAEVSKKPKRAKVKYSSRLYNNHTMIKMDDQDLDCLAKNIYHEARFEPYVGQIAVAQVTFNRVQDGKWGDSICKVVYAHKQFSWTLNKKLRNMEPKGPMWKASLHYAKMFQYGARVRELEQVKWYHADYVSPKWRNDFERVTSVGKHIFYAKAD